MFWIHVNEITVKFFLKKTIDPISKLQRVFYLDAGDLPDVHDRHLPFHFPVCLLHLSCFFQLVPFAVSPFHPRTSIAENIHTQMCHAEQSEEGFLSP